ncbi:YdeI/OmpD-associated family protein [Microbacterium sp.]|uniref:YdeI/OmpD-associated family protein n=1 Tax=Microbacterium sp. TaxID=51671 RepID=UPI003A84A372
MHEGGTADRPALFFDDAADFRAWLEGHHDTEPEVWTGLYRKGHPRRGLTWADAVPEALCFGWIDSVSQRIDEVSRRQRWSPRKASSIWSEVNIAHVERLIAEGRMTPAGLAAYRRRRPDRTGVYSHERHPELAAHERAAIDADASAAAFWEAATPSYRRAVAAWLHGAKRDRTRADRLAALVADSAAGRLVPPQRYGEPPAWLARAAAAAAAAGR